MFVDVEFNVGGGGGVGGVGGGCFFFNDTATTEIYTLSLHDALPIYVVLFAFVVHDDRAVGAGGAAVPPGASVDRER